MRWRVDAHEGRCARGRCARWVMIRNDYDGTRRAELCGRCARGVRRSMGRCARGAMRWSGDAHEGRSARGRCARWAMRTAYHIRGGMLADESAMPTLGMVMVRPPLPNNPCPLRDPSPRSLPPELQGQQTGVRILGHERWPHPLEFGRHVSVGQLGRPNGQHQTRLVGNACPTRPRAAHVAALGSVAHPRCEVGAL